MRKMSPHKKGALFMWSALPLFIRHFWFAILALVVIALMGLGLYLSVPYDWAFENDIHFPLYTFGVIGLLNLAGQLDTQSKSRWPQLRIANWSLQIAALIACYLAWLMPKELLATTLINSFIGLVLWLSLVQVSRRVLRDKTRREIASELGIDDADPVADSFANNSDLPSAVVTAVFLAAQTNALLNTWQPEMSPLVVRTSAFMVGYLTGLAYFYFCPNQSEIRETIKTRARLR